MLPSPVVFDGQKLSEVYVKRACLLAGADTTGMIRVVNFGLREMLSDCRKIAYRLAGADTSDAH